VNASHFDPENVPKFPANPVRRDVILVKSKGYAILAFRADNPGAWFLYLHAARSVNGSHCHIDWHVVAGMVAQFIEAPFEMQKRLTVPNPIAQQCKEAGIPTSGPNV
jgi:iron transport multicopper oxidase